MKVLGASDLMKRTVELEFVGSVQILECSGELATEDTAQRHDRQEKALGAVDPTRSIWRQPTCGNDVMDVWVVLQVLSPGVQHAEEANIGAEVPGIAGQLEHGFSAGTVEQVVDDPLVPERQRRELMGKREDDVEVGHRQSSAERAASHLRRALPWHFGQCRLRHEL